MSYISAFLPVCLPFVYCGMDMCSHVCACVFSGQRMALCILLYHFPPHFLRQGLLLSLELTFFFSKFPGSSCLSLPHPQCWSCMHGQSHPDFNMGSRDLNIRLHACATSKPVGHFGNLLLCFNHKGLKPKRELKKLKPRTPGMGGTHTPIPALFGRGTWISEFGASLVYRTLAF